MRALSFHGPRDVRVVDKPRPEIAHPEDAVVRVTTAGICGSDVHLYHGLVPDTRLGHTFGHECVGIVEEVGPDVSAIRPGDRVVVPFNIACGRCYFCRRRVWSQCGNANAYAELGGIYGHSRTAGGYEGMQAEYVRVPFADVGPRRLPPDVPDREAVLLADILPTAYFAADNAEIRPGDTVAVFGCGPVGILAAWCAKFLLRAGRVIAVDQVDERLALAAARCGAEPVDFRETKDVVATLREMTDGRGPDACIDAVGLEAKGSLLHAVQARLLFEAGSPTALVWAMNAVRGGGTVSVVGTYGPPFNHFFPVGWAMNRNLTMRMGQANVLNYLDPLLAAVARKQLDPSFVVTHELPLEDAPRAYELFAGKREGAIKVLLHPA